eukprot:s2418_g7.t1
MTVRAPCSCLLFFFGGRPLASSTRRFRRARFWVSVIGEELAEHSIRVQKKLNLSNRCFVCFLRLAFEPHFIKWHFTNSSRKTFAICPLSPLTMLFFLRRADGFLPVPVARERIITQDDIQAPMTEPTEAMLDMMSAEQIKALFKAFGWQLKQRTVKETFVEYALDEWAECSAHGLTIEKNYESLVRGTPKLVFYKVGQNDYLSPFLVANGQVLRESFFDNLGENILTKSMLKTLTIQELFHCQKAMGGEWSADIKKVKKAEILDYTFDHWQTFGTGRNARVEVEKTDDEEVAQSEGENSSEGVAPDSEASENEADNLEEEDTGKDYNPNYEIEILALRAFDDKDPYRLTYDSRTATFKDVKNDLKKLMSADADTFTLADKDTPSKIYEPYRRLAEFQQKGEFPILVKLKLKGGALHRGGIIKTIIKTKADNKTTAADAPKFSAVYAHAIGMATATPDNIKQIIANLDTAQLSKMIDYLEHDRTPNAKKAFGLASFLPEIGQMEEIQAKLATATEEAKGLFVAHLEQSCGDGNGGIKMAKVLRMLETRKAVNEEKQQVAVAKAKAKPEGVNADVQMKM